MCFFANEYYLQQLLKFTISKVLFLKNFPESMQNSQLLVLVYRQLSVSQLLPTLVNAQT
jgi:hypothetical protein